MAMMKGEHRDSSYESTELLVDNKDERRRIALALDIRVIPMLALLWLMVRSPLSVAWHS
jgi:hypothetical protein